MRKLPIFPILAGPVFLAWLAFARNPTDTAVTEQIRRGAALYAQHCASCHGKNLEGGSASALNDDQWNWAQSAGEHGILIKFGNEDLGMPAFDAALSDEDVDAVLAFMSTTRDRKTVKSATEAPSYSASGLHTAVWVDGLKTPWAVDITASGDALVTEKPGHLRWIRNGKPGEPIAGIPEVRDSGQGGMLDVAFDPDYQKTRWVYLSYSDLDDSGKAMTKLVRGRIKGNTWVDEQVLFEAKPEHYVQTRVHFGSRITFDGDHLYFSIGDLARKEMAQDVTKPNGKIHRIYKNGEIPEDNPFVSEPGAYKSIYAYGTRNSQGLVFTNGHLWETEHGPKGGDELNRIEKGKNYGWPKISHGRNYSGTVLTPYTHLPGMEQPVSQWTPSIAACGLDVYQGDLFPDWNGDLLVGALAYEELRLIDIEDGEYVAETILLKDKGRVRDVTTGPDGVIYVVMNRPDQILRLAPEE